MNEFIYESSRFESSKERRRGRIVDDCVRAKTIEWRLLCSYHSFSQSIQFDSNVTRGNRGTSQDHILNLC